MRRSSMRGEKSALFMKEVKEEAAHFGLRTVDSNDDIPVSIKKRQNQFVFQDLIKTSTFIFLFDQVYSLALLIDTLLKFFLFNYK